MRPLAFDLCCGSGGWASGLIQSGWRVVGYDIDPQPLYPGEFHQRDVKTIQPKEHYSTLSFATTMEARAAYAACNLRQVGLACGGGGVRVRAIISHLALKMAADPGQEVASTIRSMDRKANDGMECVWTRAYCPTENETVIYREYEYKDGCK